MYLQINAPELYHKFLKFHFFRFLFFQKKTHQKHRGNARMTTFEKHLSGQCHPCVAFALRPTGCYKGDTCTHCHHCTAEQAKARRREIQLEAKQRKKQVRGRVLKNFPPFFFVALWTMELVMIIAIIHLFDVDAVFNFQYLFALSREFPCEAHFFSFLHLMKPGLVPF